MNKSAPLRLLVLLGFFLAANGTDLRAGPLPASYRIAGTVVDSLTGQPIEGAEVTLAALEGANEAQSFLTSGDGRFVFTGLLPGKYSLLASRRGYASQALDQHEMFWTSIIVGPRLDSEHIRFRLSPSSIITGTVTDDWGDPARDAKVLLFQQDMFDGSRTLRNVKQDTTDDQGRYRFAHLRAGAYAVAVYAKPWYTQSQTGYVTSLRVVDSQSEGNSSQTLVVDHPSDIITFDGPPQLPSPDPLFDVVYPITFFPNATSLAEATRFALSPGATETADFQLRAVPSAHLRVRVPVQPPTAVTVTSETADSEENGQETRGTTSEIESSPDVSLALKIGNYYTEPIETTRKEIAPGIVEYSGIPSGGIEVDLMTSSVVSAKDGSIVSHGKTLTVSGGGEVDLTPQGDFTDVSGVVLSAQFSSPSATVGQASSDQGPSGQASPDQVPEGDSSKEMITFRSLKAGETYYATISSSGKFTFASSTLPAGSYEVEFSGQRQLDVSALEATGATVSGRTIEIPAGQPVKLTVHADEAKCSLSGFALKNGKPVAGAMVLLVPQDPGHDMSLYHRDQSDSDGSFAMSPLFPGRYILLAIENGWDLEWADPKVMFQYFPTGQPLELKPGASLTLNAKVQ